MYRFRLGLYLGLAIWNWDLNLQLRPSISVDPFLLFAADFLDHPGI